MQLLAIWESTVFDSVRGPFHLILLEVSLVLALLHNIHGQVIVGICSLSLCKGAIGIRER